MNNFLLFYVCNVFLTIFLVIIKIDLGLDCSWWWCLTPVILINLILGIVMVSMALEMVKGE